MKILVDKNSDEKDYIKVNRHIIIELDDETQFRIKETPYGLEITKNNFESSVINIEMVVSNQFLMK